jgi:O-methyltransferase
MNLIYICVFHQKSYIDLLELLINSMEENSGDLINTDILILTTSDFLPNIKEKINNVSSIKYMILDNLTTLFQAGCARLNIFSYEHIDKYEKILYLDTDILIAKSLNILFDLEINENKIYALEEGTTVDHVFYGGQFFNESRSEASKDLGASLCPESRSEASKNLTGFTSGILFFKNTNAIKDLFGSINEHIQDYIYEKHNPIPCCLDQPFIVYHSISQNKYDNQLLKKYIENKHDYNLTDKIIYHFPGGPGNYQSKYIKMTNFYCIFLQAKYSNKYIIQVGSHIGNTSNDYLFNKINPNFKYIMIEPVPYLFNQLKENYKSYNNITFLNIAISNYDGVLDLYIPSEKNDFTKMVSWASQLSSVNKDHISYHVPECIIEKISVECKTLNILIKEFNIKEIEYLYTDTEGHDYDILMDLDLSYIKPKNIIFENKHMDGTKNTLDINDCSKYLNLLNHFEKNTYILENQTLEDTHIKLKELPDFVKEITSKETTLVSGERLINLSHQCSRFKDSTYSFVECGVAKGGCLAMMKYCSGINNKIFGFDSFEGMPDIDSDKDISDYNKSDPLYWVGKPLCNGIDSVYDTFDKLNLNTSNVNLVKGFFQDTLNIQKNIEDVGEIAVLRLDADWYDSTMVCLEKLYDKVIDGGVIIIDDYGHFIGAKRATDEFREKYNIRSPLIQTDYTEYYWVKNTNPDIIYSVNKLENKRYSWQSGNIKFLENGNMEAFGPGNYEFISPNVIKANFGYRVHTITFNKDFTEFISIRVGDNEVVTGLKI